MVQFVAAKKIRPHQRPLHLLYCTLQPPRGEEDLYSRAPGRAQGEESAGVLVGGGREGRWKAGATITVKYPLSVRMDIAHVHHD